MAELTALLHRAYAPLAAAGMRFLASHQDEAKTRERCAEGECWVAVEGPRIVGTISWRPSRGEPGTWYGRPGVASFGQFAVEPELQGRGIGRELIGRVEQRAREEGYAELACDTAEGAAELIALYARLGYRLVGHVQWDVTNYRSVVLSKRLDA